jgi:hypothetical protein
MCRHLRLLSLFLVVFVAPALALPADGNSNSIGDNEFSPKGKRSGYCQTG